MQFCDKFALLYLEIIVKDHLFRITRSQFLKWLFGPGAGFLKLLVITGPVKLFCLPLRMGVSKVWKMVQ